MTVAATGHGDLMDRVYRRQKYIYDATRKFYLFGRDGLIAALDARAGTRVIELGCGTGRNLAKIARTWPAAHLHGIDISQEMLGYAARRLGPDVLLAPADATAFDARALFGVGRFDRVVIAYALSMIPDWRAVLAHAIDLAAPGGSVHVVDFGDLGGLPRPLASALRRWLAHFHVAPRDRLADVAATLAAERGCTIAVHDGPMRYYQAVTIRRGI